MKALRLNILACAFVIPAFLLAAGCGSDDNTGTSGEEFPELEIVPAGTCLTGDNNYIESCSLNVDQSGILVGEQVPTVVRIRNTGERRMKLESIQLEYTSPDGVVEDPPAFALNLPGTFEAGKTYVAPAGEGSDDTPEELPLQIIFTRYDEDFRTAKLIIDTDAVNADKGRIEILIKTTLGPPSISVTPEFVDFEQVGKGKTKDENVNILNVGGSDLKVTGFSLQGSPYFSLLVEGVEYKASKETAEGVTFETPLVILPQNSYSMKIRFKPETSDPANAVVLVKSNDPVRGDGVQINATGNESVPCIDFNPPQVNFGARKYGEMSTVPLEIKACGQAPLNLYGFRIKEGSSPDFDYDTSTLDHDPTDENPVVVPIGGSVVVKVTFVPDQPNPVDGNNNPILDTGDLIVMSNAFEEESDVPLSGAGIEIKCPVAIIKCQEGDEVIPQTVLHLRGDQSYAEEGTLEKWEWNVVQPAGSASTFIPSNNFLNPSFEVNVAGPYTFSLDVIDSQGLRSCEPAVYEVVVIPDEAIHIELLWHTPEDPDETNTGPEAGTDMDLHFVHPLAGGPDLDGDGKPDGWFAIPYDAYWFNAFPNWGSINPSVNDDPSLDRDDTDGAGPENINLDMPEELVYRVGVHYWDDHGYGSSLATLRVYIYSVLIFEVTDVMMIDLDMWEVCTVEWPSGKVQVVVDDMGQYKITPDYEKDLGVQP